MLKFLTMSAERVNLGFPKMKVFEIKGYDVIIFLHDVTNQILSCDSNYMTQNYSNSSTSIREVITTSIL